MNNFMTIVVCGLLICLLSISSIAIIKDWNKVNDVELMSEDDINNQLEQCPNFNGHDFLLSGGTGRPQTIEEINYEIKRMNWLCNGGEK